MILEKSVREAFAMIFQGVLLGAPNIIAGAPNIVNKCQNCPYVICFYGSTWSSSLLRIKLIRKGLTDQVDP